MDSKLQWLRFFKRVEPEVPPKHRNKLNLKKNTRSLNRFVYPSHQTSNDSEISCTQLEYSDLQGTKVYHRVPEKRKMQHVFKVNKLLE